MTEMFRRLLNIFKKPWYPTTLRLSDLERRIKEIRAQLADGEDPRIVLVYTPSNPREAGVVGIVTRSDALDAASGDAYNALASTGELTQSELEERSLDDKAQLKQGEVVYILAHPDSTAGSKELFTHL